MISQKILSEIITEIVGNAKLIQMSFNITKSSLVNYFLVFLLAFPFSVNLRWRPLDGRAGAVTGAGAGARSAGSFADSLAGTEASAAPAFLITFALQPI